jgi:4-amino-4-deoxy-L-arabinose transferase-like glycosyltransferase
VDDADIPAKPATDSIAHRHLARSGFVAFAAAAVVAAVTVATELGRYSGNYDEGVYWQSLRALDRGHHLFAQVFSSQPPLFLMSVLPFFHVGGPSIAAGRVAILLVAVIGLLATFMLGKLVDRTTGVVAVALLLSYARFVSDAATVQATLPAVALSTVGVALAAVAGRAQRGRLLGAGAAGVALGAATMIKLVGVVAVPPALFLLLSARWTPRPAAEGQRGSALPDRGGRGRALTPGWWQAAAALAIGFLIVNAIVLASFWNHGKFYDQVVRFHLDARGGAQQTLRTLINTGVRAPLLAVGVAAIVIILVYRISTAYVYAVWLISGLAVLALQRPLFPDHVLVLAPPAALILAGLLSWVWARPTGVWVRSIVGVAVALVLLIGGVRVAVDAARAHGAPNREAAMIASVRRHVAPTTLVVTDDQYLIADARRDVPPELVDTSYVRIASGHLTANQLIRITDRSAHAVLFTGGRFEQLPDFRSWVKAHFDLVEDFGLGAALYARHR